MSTDLLILVTSTALAAVAAVAVTTPAGPSSRPVTQSSTLRSLAAGAFVAIVLIAASGWAIPAVVAGTAVALTVGRRQRHDPRPMGGAERTDAIASWIEGLRDVLVAGDQPIGAIAATVSSCPPAIRPPVRRLSTSLGHQDPDTALRRFADDLDDPLGDLVAAGVLVAIQRGAQTVPVLTSLADQARLQADRRRILEAERAPVRREVRLLAALMAGLLATVLVLGRSDYLSAYDRAGGQVFLAVVVAIYALLLVRVHRLALYPTPGRFLVGHTPQSGSTQPT